MSVRQSAGGQRGTDPQRGLNAMVGNPGELTNQFNPAYVQFYRISEMPDPSRIFVFLDEHCDTVNDGFFVNRLDTFEWGNAPGSYHNNAVNLSFADGHVETHLWTGDAIRPRARAAWVALTRRIPPPTSNGSSNARA